MNRKKTEIIITSILGIVLVVGAVRLISTAKTKKSPPVPIKKTTFAKIAAVERLAHIEAEAEKISWERNPFIRGRTSASAGAVSLALSGIMWDEKTPTAIIGDTVVKEGDAIGKYKVIKINKDSVVLTSGEGEKTLSIWE